MAESKTRNNPASEIKEKELGNENVPDTNDETPQTPDGETQASAPNPSTDIAALEAKVTEAREQLAAANAKANEGTAAIMSVQPIDFVALAELSAPVKKATDLLEARMDVLREAKAADRWEQSIEIRQPVLDILREYVVDKPLPVKATLVSGPLTIGDDDAISVTLTAIVEKPDMTEIEEAVAAMVDVAKFKEVDIRELFVSVDLKASPATISLAPVSKLNAAGKTAAKGKTPKAPKAEGESSGEANTPWEYLYNGEALSSKEFLTALETEKNPVTTDRAQAFETALRGTGNGLANLAESVAKGLNVTRRRKAATA